MTQISWVNPCNIIPSSSDQRFIIAILLGKVVEHEIYITVI